MCQLASCRTTVGGPTGTRQEYGLIADDDPPGPGLMTRGLGLSVAGGGGTLSWHWRTGVHSRIAFSTHCRAQGTVLATSGRQPAHIFLPPLSRRNINAPARPTCANTYDMLLITAVDSSKHSWRGVRLLLRTGAVLGAYQAVRRAVRHQHSVTAPRTAASEASAAWCMVEVANSLFGLLQCSAFCLVELP